MRGVRSAVVLIMAGLLVGCAPQPPAGSATSSTPAADAQVRFASVVDGDTIETSEGTVRIIGVDAPERGACGYAEASAFIASLLSEGDPIILTLPDGQNDEDRHGRMLRYVDTEPGVDVGSSILAAGLGIARYDSTDGYPSHPREADYHAAQIATSDAAGAVTTVACKAAADAAEQARIAAEQQAAEVPDPAPVAEEWWRQYTSCTKLKNNANGNPTGPFSRNNPSEAAIYDWFANGTGNNGDGEGDGLACE
ncbi:thermonuclease family protein [Microbacterium sp. P03]|uniref:thermonuclease family protein n=1 Tax=Microbacterium sp. P03 TaxID=3366946 RepID=UPI003746C051